MIKSCVFPVAGYGTRFLPATKSIPKEMLPIVARPLIEYGVEEARDAGLTDICFVTGRNKQAIENHFDFNYELENEIRGSGKEQQLSQINELIEACSFTSIRQLAMKGLGHAIGRSEPAVKGDAFAVLLPDDLCLNPDGEGVMSQMVALYNRYQCSIVAIEEVPQDQVHKYGVIAATEEAPGIYRVEDMVEKPPQEEAPSNLAIIGRYILTADIFELIRNTAPGKNSEIQITDAILKQAKQGKVIGYKFAGRRFDCGSLDGFVEATNFCYERYYRD